MRVAVTFGNDIRVGPYEAALLEAGIQAVRNPESLDSLDGRAHVEAHFSWRAIAADYVAHIESLLTHG